MQQRVVRICSSNNLLLSQKQLYKYRSFSASNPFADIEDTIVDEFKQTSKMVDYKDEIAVWDISEKGLKTHRVYNTDKDNQVVVFSFNEKHAYSLAIQSDNKILGKFLHFDIEEKLTVPFIDSNDNVTSSFNSLYKKKDLFPGNNVEVLQKSIMINPEEKRLPRFQVRTGYIPIDYTNPIAEGSFCVFHGKSHTGKFDLMKATITKFLQENTNSVAVYFSLYKREAASLKNFFEKNGINPSKYVIFCPDNETSKTDRFLTGQCALKYATNYRDQGKNVIFCMKDIFEYSISINAMYQAMKIPKPDINLFYELASQSYCVTSNNNSNGSITSILSITDDEVAEYYVKDQMDLKNMLLSLSNVVVEFDLEDKRFRGMKPLVGMQFQDVPLNCQWFVQRKLMTRLSDLVVKLQNDTENYNLQKDLKIHIDPWDYYLVHDSNYFLKFLMNAKDFDYYQQLLQVHFVVKGVEEDVLSFFQEDPDIVTDKYFAFIEEFRLNDKNTTVEWLKFIRDNKLEDLEEHHIFDNLDRVFHMFFLDQKDKGFLLQHKNDYID